jgi:hypothetical protein
MVMDVGAVLPGFLDDNAKEQGSPVCLVSILEREA